MYPECTLSDSRMRQESHIRCSEGYWTLEIILSLYELLNGGGMLGMLYSCLVITAICRKLNIGHTSVYRAIR